MATLYVNSITGNNSNSGASWALAKLTLAAANMAASVGDTIYCHGRFIESMVLSKAVKWIGFGYCVVDGGNTLSGPTTSAAACYVSRFTFANFPTHALAWGSSIYVDQCDFINCGKGIYCFSSYIANAGQFITVTNSRFFGNSYGVWLDYSNSRFTNCTFAGNTVAVYSATASYAMILFRNAYSNAINLQITSAASISTTSDQNAYDFAAGKNIIGGVDKTTLASWIAAITSPTDVVSVDRSVSNDIGDSVNGLLSSNPSSYLLTGGIGSTPIGYPIPAVTVSNNKNSTLWTGGVFSNTEIDGSGFLVLSAGQTSGYWRSDIIDFGASISAKSLDVSVAGEDATNYLDYDTGDSPGYFTARVRGSNVSFAKADASPSWVTVPRNAEIGAYMSNALRYWQVELTLRGP